ncbi:MAG TPA: hypothetical protein VL242_10910 [Sorangium sp.]|nr:hypothetical protein [Sorangium sp.]
MTNTLYAFHQGGGSKGDLWYNTFDGTVWSGDRKVFDVGMSGSPSALVSAISGKELLYLFHQGSGNNGELWFSTFDGTNWLGDKHVEGLSMSGSPSAIVFNNRIYVFHQSFAGGELWYANFDGTVWKDKQIMNVSMSASPSAAICNVSGVETLHVFHQGFSGGELWCATTTDGEQWEDNQITAALTRLMLDSPSAMTFDGQIRVYSRSQGVLHNGTIINNAPLYIQGSGTSWSGAFGIPWVCMSATPSAATLTDATGKETIYVLHQGCDNNGQLWYFTDDGTKVSNDQQVSNLEMSESPSAIAWSHP